MATEECIFRRDVEELERVNGAVVVAVVVVVVVAPCGRTIDAARRGKVAVEERKVVRRLRVEENVIADFTDGLEEGGGERK